jgi:hypothetical protein
LVELDKKVSLGLMDVNIRSSNKTQFIWKLRKQSIEKCRSLASSDALQQFELVLSMITIDALYNGEIEYISDESSSNNITGKYDLLFFI